MRYILVLLLAGLYAFMECPDFLLDKHSWVAWLTYSFFHGNVFHWAANMLALWSIFNPKHKHNARQLFIGYLIALAVYPLSFKPVVGISNILYAVLGMRTPAFNHPWWEAPTTITFLVITIAMVFIPNISAVTHIASFALGTLLSCVNRGITSLKNDYERAINQ